MISNKILKEHAMFCTVIFYQYAQYLESHNDNTKCDKSSRLQYCIVKW